MLLINLANLDKDSYIKLADSKKYNELIKKSFCYLWDTCSQEEIQELLGCYYLIEKESKDGKSNITELLDSLGQEWFSLSSKDDTCILSKEELPDALCRLDCGEAAIVRQVPAADFCGHILFTTDHKIFIEVLRGGLLGFFEALEMPTYYVLDKSGIIISKEERTISQYYDFDTQKGKWVLVSGAEEGQLTLSENQLMQLFELLFKINKNEIYMKLEWIYRQGNIYLYNIALPLGLGIVE